jgi:hypothetical protein
VTASSAGQRYLLKHPIPHYIGLYGNVTRHGVYWMLINEQKQIIPTPIIMNGLISKPEPHFRNKPVDCAVASLFDTAYVPKMLQNSQLLWRYYDRWIKTSQTMISGTPNGPDQWVGRVGKGRNHVDSGTGTLVSI